MACGENASENASDNMTDACLPRDTVVWCPTLNGWVQASGNQQA